MMNKDEGGIRSVAKALQILEAFDGEHRTLRVTDLARGTEETAKLGVRVGLSVVVLEAVESPRVLHTRGDVGVVAPLYCTALGKAVLAFLPEEERERIVGALTLRAYTPRTVGGREALRRELERIRVRGYATDVQEHEGDVRCVGAPVRDGRGYPVGAVSVSGPAQRMPLRRLGELGPRVVEVAEAGETGGGGGGGGAGAGGRGGGGGDGAAAGGPRGGGEATGMREGLRGI